MRKLNVRSMYLVRYVRCVPSPWKTLSLFAEHQDSPVYAPAELPLRGYVFTARFKHGVFKISKIPVVVRTPLRHWHPGAKLRRTSHSCP